MIKNQNRVVSEESRLRQLLIEIYKDHSEEEVNIVSSQLLQILEEFSQKSGYEENQNKELWDQTSSILITYADGVYKNDESSIKTLQQVIDNYFDKLSSIVHILPFLRSTSDGGFAVSSHNSIEKRFGDWEDLKSFSTNHEIMADLVLNHISSSHKWVKQFIKNEEPGTSFVLSPSQALDWQKVIRPRSSSLFVDIATSQGLKPVWTTFGPDQIDLNWLNPYLNIEFLNLIKRYVSSGINWLRLDAVGFIWKEPGTTCLHLNEVHKIVKVLRIQLKSLSNKGVLITETNVPQRENLSYLESGDEADIAYNFPLPPLILEALISNKADLLNSWLSNWPDLNNKTTFLNFTASHDGVGLRAVEGIMNEDRLKNLLINCERRGGLVTHRKLSNGGEKPYELNISWWSAMADGGRNPRIYQMEKFLLSQLLVMSLKGIPAFYFQALLASENDMKTFLNSGQRRDLNRERFEYEKLELILKDSNSYASKILFSLNKAMIIRGSLNSFHPNQEFKCLTKDRSDVVTIKRGNGNNTIWAIHNITSSKLTYKISDSFLLNKQEDIILIDLLTNQYFYDFTLDLQPYEVVWLGLK